MIATISRMNANKNVAQTPKTQTSFNSYSLQSNCKQAVLPNGVIEDLIDGIMILDEHRELIYANDCAQRILRQLNSGSSPSNSVPEEVRHICLTLIQSRHLFPNQYWSIESKIFVDSSIAFNVRARWLKLEDMDRPCLLLSIRDQYQDIKNIVNEESQKYGLTSREKEIWLLHRANYTYKQVAVELCITPNTVKKHMKNIYLKQKSYQN